MASQISTYTCTAFLETGICQGIPVRRRSMYQTCMIGSTQNPGAKNRCINSPIWNMICSEVTPERHPASPKIRCDQLDRTFPSRDARWRIRKPKLMYGACIIGSTLALKLCPYIVLFEKNSVIVQQYPPRIRCPLNGTNPWLSPWYSVLTPIYSFNLNDRIH